MPFITWDISAGQIGEIAAMVIGGFSFMFTMRDRLTRLEKDVQIISSAMLTLARQDERIKAQDDRLKALERHLRLASAE